VLDARPPSSQGDQESRRRGAHARSPSSDLALGVGCATADAEQCNCRPSDSVTTHPLECVVWCVPERPIDPPFEQLMDTSRTETWPAEIPSWAPDAPQAASATASTPLPSARLARRRPLRFTGRRATPGPAVRLGSTQPLSAPRLLRSSIEAAGTASRSDECTLSRVGGRASTVPRRRTLVAENDAQRSQGITPESSWRPSMPRGYWAFTLAVVT